MAVATVGAPALRRERAAEPVAERAPQRPIQLEARPEPLGPVRGIALAVAMGVGAWALIFAILLRF
jgi:hypothetical protein